MPPVKRWVVVEEQPDVERRLRDELGVSSIVAHLLATRGLSQPAQVERFLNPRLADLPHPDSMCGAVEAARRVADAVSRRESIVIHGDYDADGVTASALLVDFFRNLGQPVNYYIPHRLEQGYGLGVEAIRELAAAGHKLLITVDCGSNDIEAVTLARELGLDVIVTDHHEITGELPPAVAVLNPRQPGCGFADEPLAGVGVAFFLAAAVRRELAARGDAAAESFDLKRLLDLVALGTVADIVPLTGVNRTLVVHGLPLIDADQRVGLTALKKVAGVRNSTRASDISFRIAPRINAAGRMGNAEIAVELLLTDDADRARDIATHLHEENTRRQGIESEIFNQARKMFLDIPKRERLRSIVLAHPDWHQGVIGIVASRLVDAFGRPTILLSASGEVSTGSGRSIPDFNLHEAIGACAEHLEGFGGHAQAAGLQIKTSNIVAFAKDFDIHARQHLRPEDMVPRQRIDAWCSLDDISEKLVRELGSLAPFGCGNPEPVLAARDVELLNKQIVGRDHLKLRVPCRRAALAVIAYGFAEMHDRIGSRVDLAFTPEFNYYGGVEHVQLRARDIAIPDL